MHLTKTAIRKAWPVGDPLRDEWERYWARGRFEDYRPRGVTFDHGLPFAVRVRRLREQLR